MPDSHLAWEIRAWGFQGVGLEFRMGLGLRFKVSFTAQKQAPPAK